MITGYDRVEAFTTHHARHLKLRNAKQCKASVVIYRVIAMVLLSVWGLELTLFIAGVWTDSAKIGLRPDELYDAIMRTGLTLIGIVVAVVVLAKFTGRYTVTAKRAVTAIKGAYAPPQKGSREDIRYGTYNEFPENH